MCLAIHGYDSNFQCVKPGFQKDLQTIYHYRDNISIYEITKTQALLVEKYIYGAHLSYESCSYPTQNTKDA